jgi:nitroreductase
LVTGYRRAAIEAK